jgi:hypothetical protein
MSNLSENEKYHKKYLKYKQKYIALEQEIGGGSKWKAVKSAAKKGATYAHSIASNPAVQAVASSAASAALATASQQPQVQAKLAQAQQYYANSPNVQIAAQVAMTHPKVQSAMAHPMVQSAIAQSNTAQSNTAQSNTAQSNNSQSTMAQPDVPTQTSQNPDDVWKTLSMSQKQKLIAMLN